MYSQLNIKCVQQQRQIIFKFLKPEMYLITKENSLPTSQKERCFLITVTSPLNDLRANDR
jgi:hypothetical protein